jgi:sugar (pentulose or hexulose) kinase
VTEAVAAAIGLARPVPVYCGIHDSNASLLPHLGHDDAPFSVVSTGTWIVLFAVGGDLDHLDPHRDTLANVDAFARAVPSARFMGGREFELLTKGQGAATPEAIRRIVEDGILPTPSVVSGCGPFPDARHQIVNAPTSLSPDESYVAASLYTALTTKACLDLTRATGPIIVEGPFARNALFAEALSKSTERPVIPVPSSTGTSVGAALLAAGPSERAVTRSRPAPTSDQLPESFGEYASEWNRIAQAG